MQARELARILFPVTGHNNDRHIAGLTDFFHQPDAVKGGHVQVGDDQINPTQGILVQPLFTSRRGPPSSLGVW